jgi:hypothetical protein
MLAARLAAAQPARPAEPGAGRAGARARAGPESMRAPRRRRTRRRAPAPTQSTPDGIGDLLNPRSGRALQREIVAGVFGLLRKRL